MWIRGKPLRISGGRGIRTPEGLAALAVFKTAPFNRSGIPPRGSCQCRRRRPAR